MECKRTILMRALLAVALVALTRVLTYEFWRDANVKFSMDEKQTRVEWSVNHTSALRGRAATW